LQEEEEVQEEQQEQKSIEKQVAIHEKSNAKKGKWNSAQRISL
jgi:hypothetical protein